MLTLFPPEPVYWLKVKVTLRSEILEVKDVLTFTRFLFETEA